jgi:pilus assembly protein CpaD
MRHLILLPALAAAFALSACGGTQNRGLESVHQPVISRTDFVYDVSSRMGTDDRAKVAAWMRSLDVGYGDRISVDDPSDSAAVRDAIADVAAYHGLTLDPAAPRTAGAIAPGDVRIVVSRTKAEVPGCPDWSRSSRDEFNNDLASNYGCATNASLAAMVANPEDLVSGKQRAPTGYNKLGARRARDNRGGN